MQQSETNVIMTPELRNDIIREAIEEVRKYDNLGVCCAIYKACPLYVNDVLIGGIEASFQILDIPFIFHVCKFYWPIEDRESRISFLKAQITC